MIAIKDRGRKDYTALSSELVWLEPETRSESSIGIEFRIGAGDELAHGTLIAPLLPAGQAGAGHLVSRSHAHRITQDYRSPSHTQQGPSKKRVARWNSLPEIIAADVNANGLLDIVTAPFARNMGMARSAAKITEGFPTARRVIAKRNDDAGPTSSAPEKRSSISEPETPLSRLAWFRSPEAQATDTWKVHVIDAAPLPSFAGSGGLDSDGGRVEFFSRARSFLPYHSECRLMVYKKADPSGRALTPIHDSTID